MLGRGVDRRRGDARPQEMEGKRRSSRFLCFLLYIRCYASFLCAFNFSWGGGGREGGRREVTSRLSLLPRFFGCRLVSFSAVLVFSTSIVLASWIVMTIDLSHS